MSKKSNAVRMVEQAGIAYNLLPYAYEDENLNVANIAQKNQLDLALIYKTLVLRGDKTGIVVAVVPGDHNLLTKNLAAVSNNKKMNLLPAFELPGATGYVRGGCSPIGMKKNHPVFLDSKAQPRDTIYINAGKKGLLMQIAPADIISLCAATWAELTD